MDTGEAEHVADAGQGSLPRPTEHDLRVLLDGNFDAAAYWRYRVHKTWVVDVSAKRRAKGGVARVHTMYVRAVTKDGAERTARENTSLEGKVSASARLATPRDLGAVRTH
jgi:hypothetical protein